MSNRGGVLKKYQSEEYPNLPVRQSSPFSRIVSLYNSLVYGKTCSFAVHKPLAVEGDVVGVASYCEGARADVQQQRAGRHGVRVPSVRDRSYALLDQGPGGGRPGP